METKRIEKINYECVYVAADGTEFKFEEECLKYERSAAAVLRCRVKKLAIYDGDETSVFECGCPDNGMMVVVAKNENDLALIRQYIMVAGDQSADYVSKLEDDQVGRPIALFAGYENDGCWFTTFDKILEIGTAGKFKVVAAE